MFKNVQNMHFLLFSKKLEIDVKMKGDELFDTWCTPNDPPPRTGRLWSTIALWVLGVESSYSAGFLRSIWGFFRKKIFFVSRAYPLLWGPFFEKHQFCLFQRYSSVFSQAAKNQLKITIFVKIRLKSILHVPSWFKLFYCLQQAFRHAARRFWVPIHAWILFRNTVTYLHH